MKKAIAYYRVSTDRQGQSGLGLEAQKKSVMDFIRLYGYTLENEFIEIESGKRSSRPVLATALARCRTEDATLLIAKLDRLARNVAFISSLMEAKIRFKAADYPDAEDVILHVMAAFAQHERVQISKRTIAALQVAKARGVSLGKYGREVLSRQNHEMAAQFAAKMRPVIEELRRKGIKTIRAITDELNRRKVPTFRNTKWHPNTVHQLVKRINEVT